MKNKINRIFQIIGKITNPIILSILYFLFFFPTKIFKIILKIILFRKTIDTNWVKNTKNIEKNSLEDQF